MRKVLLTMLAALCTLGIQAQSDYTTAVELELDKEYDLNWADSSYSYYWFKYTPTENMVLEIESGVSRSNFNIRAIWEEGSTEPTSLTYVRTEGEDGNYVYFVRLAADSTYYLRFGGISSNYQYCNAKMTEAKDINIPDNSGESEDEAVEITEGYYYFLGDIYNDVSGYVTYYVTYTAAESGLLKLYSFNEIYDSENYVYEAVVTHEGEDSTITFTESASLNEDLGWYVYTSGVFVNEGETYTIEMSPYRSVTIITSKMTHPTAGSEDMPFNLVIGENTVPDSVGTYYYTWNNDTITGYATIEGTASDGTTLTVYESSYYDYGYSETSGNFDCNWELYYEDCDYIIVVEKTEATDNEETFTFSARAYDPGETEDNPIEVELTADATSYDGVVPGGTSAYYYTVTCDSLNETDTVVIYAYVTSELSSSWTTMTLSEESSGSSWWSASNNAPGWGSSNSSSGTYAVSLVCTAGDTYTFTWSSYEDDSITFKLEAREYTDGDDIDNALTAVEGSNTVPENMYGTVYYAYTPSQYGKLTINVNGTHLTPSVYENDENTSVDCDSEGDSIYTCEVDTANIYYIEFSETFANDVFTLSIGEYGEGEKRGTAISLNDLENNLYVINDSTPANAWFKYIVENGDNVVDISTSLIGVTNSYALYGYTNDSESGWLVRTRYYDEAGTSSYNVEAARNDYETGDTVYLYIYSSTAFSTGDSIWVEERDAEEGETAANPYELTVNGDSLFVGRVPSSNTVPVWIKVGLGVGTDTLHFTNNYTYFYLYEGEESALEDIEDSATYAYDTQYMYTIEVEEQEYYYLKIEGSTIRYMWATGSEYVEEEEEAATTVSDSLLIDGDAEYTANQVLTGSKCTLTLGNDTWTNKGANDDAGEPFYAYIVGNNNPVDDNSTKYTADGANVPTSGGYVIVTTDTVGTVCAGMMVNSGKPFYVVKSDGTMVDPSELTIVDGDGETQTLDDSYQFSSKFYGTVTFTSEAGESYYIFCTGSKAGYYGVVFTYESESTEDSGEDGESDGITSVSASSNGENGTYNVYTISGMHVMNTTESTDIKSLPKGIYIVNGKKVVVK